MTRVLHIPALTLVVAWVALAGETRAESPVSHLNGIGRFIGWGWSDGYHAGNPWSTKVTIVPARDVGCAHAEAWDFRATVSPVVEVPYAPHVPRVLAPPRRSPAAPSPSPGTAPQSPGTPPGADFSHWNPNVNQPAVPNSFPRTPVFRNVNPAAFPTVAP